MKMHEVQTPPTRAHNYVAPATIDDTIALLARSGGNARIVAGGSDLLVELDRGAHPGTETLVDISRIAGLDRIEETNDGGLRLGAAVTHNQVVGDLRCVERALPLAQACIEVGSPQLRNRATIVGNIVTASPANDTIGPLMVLRAVVDIAGPRGERTEPIDSFITGFRTTTLAPDEMVTGLTIPAPAPRSRSVFVKAGLRRAQAISVANLAACITFEEDDKTVASALLALGSVAPKVVWAPIDELLRGRYLDAASVSDAAAAAVATAKPIDDLRSTADYRNRAIEVMTRRALTALAEDSQAKTWPSNTPMLWADGFRGAFPEVTTTTAITVGDRFTFELNGRTVAVEADPRSTLLDFLRDAGGTKGVKEGCAEGECGACTVQLDGAAVMSCLVPSARAAGASITTVEGLAAPDGTLHSVQSAFAECGAAQCGFCTPGLLMSSAILIDEIAEPDRDQIRAGLAGNLCRCTGYGAIEAAVELAAGEESK